MQLQRVHVDLAAAVFADITVKLRSKDHCVPVGFQRIHTVFIGIIDRIVRRYGRTCRLAGSMHPVNEKRVFAVIRSCKFKRFPAVRNTHAFCQILQGRCIELAGVRPFRVRMILPALRPLFQYLCANNTLEDLDLIIGVRSMCVLGFGNNGSWIRQHAGPFPARFQQDRRVIQFLGSSAAVRTERLSFPCIGVREVRSCPVSAVRQAEPESEFCGLAYDKLCISRPFIRPPAIDG